jgi:hypothetical protein
MAVPLMRELILEAFVGNRPILVFSTGNSAIRNSSEVGRDDPFLIAPSACRCGPLARSVQRRGPRPG